MRNKIVLNAKEAAKHLGANPSTIYRLEKKGLIPSAKSSNGKRYYSKRVIDKYKRTIQLKEPETSYIIEMTI